MENQEFYLYTALSLISGALAPLAYLNFDSGLFAGASSLAALGFFELALNHANSTGKTDRIKIALSTVKPIYEILVLLAITTSSFVPPLLGFAVISGVLLSQVLRHSLTNQLRQSIKPQLGQRFRVGVAGITYIMASANPFYVFYGAAVIGAIALYDVIYILYRALES